MAEKTVVLLSGGLDSTTCAYLAKSKGKDIYALSFDYGQSLRRELAAARIVANAVGAKEHVVMTFDLTRWGGSALTDSSLNIPIGRSIEDMEQTIPTTYVPGRNTLFLSFGLSYAEAVGASSVMIGVNAYDYSGYPDCRPEFISAYQEMARLGTKAGLEGNPIEIKTPLLMLTKKEIVELGISVGADYSISWSCYLGRENVCGQCDACILREKGFREAGRIDPALRLP